MKFNLDYLEEAEAFLHNDISKSTQLKFAKVFRKVQEGNNTANDFCKMPGTDGIYEFRVTDSGAWYRILAFMVRYPEDNCTTIIATHGFKKKTNKIPSSEIDKAKQQRKKFIG